MFNIPLSIRTRSINIREEQMGFYACFLDGGYASCQELA